MSYDINDIKELTYPTNIQTRMGMYLGSSAKSATTPGQKNVCVREITDNSVTEAIKGCCTNINITFNEDGSVVVEDNGRGIPVGKDKETGETGIEKCVAKLHAGGNFDDLSDGKPGPGLNGVGSSAVNAVSELFRVDVYKNGWLYSEEFSNGLVKKEMHRTKLEEDSNPSTPIKEKTGTTVTFKLNDDFFSSVDNLIIDDIIDRLRYTVYVVPGLSINVFDNTRTSEEGGGEFHFEGSGGIEDMLDYISSGNPAIVGKGSDYEKKGIFKISTSAKYKKKITSLDKEGNSVAKEKTFNIPIECAIRYGSEDKPDIRSFANTIQTFNGGIHEDALKNALMDTFGKLAKSTQR